MWTVPDWRLDWVKLKINDDVCSCQEAHPESLMNIEYT